MTKQRRQKIYICPICRNEVDEGECRCSNCKTELTWDAEDEYEAYDDIEEW